MKKHYKYNDMPTHTFNLKNCDFIKENKKFEIVLINKKIEKLLEPLQSFGNFTDIRIKVDYDYGGLLEIECLENNKIFSIKLNCGYIKELGIPVNKYILKSIFKIENYLNKSKNFNNKPTMFVSKEYKIYQEYWNRTENNKKDI